MDGWRIEKAKGTAEKLAGNEWKSGVLFDQRRWSKLASNGGNPDGDKIGSNKPESNWKSYNS